MKNHISSKNLKKVSDFLESLGIVLEHRSDGRVFPKTQSARDVLFLMKKKLKKNVAITKTGKTVNDFVNRNGVFTVKCKKGETFEAGKLIIATGGCSYAGTGSTGEGLKWAQNKGQKIEEISPALVSLKLKKNPFFIAQGQRCICSLGLSQKNCMVFSTKGEVLFTGYGVSGPVVLNISLYYKNKKNNQFLFFDFFPNHSKKHLLKIYNERSNYLKTKDVFDVLRGWLPEKIIKCFQKHFPTEKSPEEVFYRLKNWTTEINDTMGYDNAMITKGGISFYSISKKNMMSTKIKDLYFVGEMLDITGISGGFNLFWAFHSGLLAGEHV